ncbi:MAG: Gfo/Idh/MocA family oxidoreductase [Bryobacteraceae bacterium]
MTMREIHWVAAVLVGACLPGAGAELRLGIIGTDTSHAIAFTQLLNDPAAGDRIAGARVVAAYKGGSPDIAQSATRVEGYARDLQTKWGVEIVPDIPTLCGKVDAILLLSVDGRVHLEQAKLAFAAHKPMFIDKPLAATLEDAREIDRLATEAGVGWFSSSSLRFSDVVAVLKSPDAQAVFTWGPGPLEEHHHLDLSWYAIHPIEILYALLGPGCQEVTRLYTADGDVITGKWSGGRTGTVRTLRPYGGYGGVVFRPNHVVVQSPPLKSVGYHELVTEIVKFFNTGKPPVPHQETLEIFAFMDAALRSMQDGGRPVRLPAIR